MTTQLLERPSLDDVQNETRHYLLALSILLNDFYGDHALRAVLKGKPGDNTDFDVLSNADVSKLRLVRLLPEAYDYAFNGRMTDVMEEQAFESPSYFDQLNDFLQMLESNSLIECVWNEPSIATHEFPSGGLRQLIDTGLARAFLDQDFTLQAKDIALLAGIAERSVQNAFSAKGSAKLNAEKQKGSSYVSADEAKRWLADKKGFIPTVRIRFGFDDPLPEALHSQAEVRAFLLPKIARLFGDDIEKFNQEIGLSNEDAVRKLNGDTPIEMRDAVPIAKALQLESKWLVTQIFRINHPKEASLLLTDQG